MQTHAREDAQARRERLRRRLIAARALADLTVEQLATRLKDMGYERGYSAKTLGNMERGTTPIQPQALPALAQACGVSAAFFSVDFATLEDASTRSLLEQRLAAVEAAVTRLTGEDAPSAPSDVIAPPDEDDETSSDSAPDGVTVQAPDAGRGTHR